MWHNGHIVPFLISSLIVKEPFNDSYVKTCEELVAKRNFLRDYVIRLRSPVQDLRSIMINSKNEKQRNMDYQRVFTEKCSRLTPPIDALNSSGEFVNSSTEAIACRALASTDKYQLELLPDIDVFYATILLENEDKLDYALRFINFYTKIYILYI